jgi:putative ABC transport system permease protein
MRGIVQVAVMFAAIVGAARTLRRHPPFVLASVFTLALGISATVALFSVVNAVLLKPLPYPGYQDIYEVRTFFPSGRFTSGLVAAEELTALQQISEGVTAAAAALRLDGAIATDSMVRQAVSYGVSEQFFDLFGVPVALGRQFAPEDHILRAPRVVVLSHALWQSAFGGRPDVIGTVMTVGGLPTRVVGIARPDFNVPAGADLWYNVALPQTSIGHTYEAYVRLKPHTTVETIRGRMTQAMEVLGRKYPDQDNGRAYALRPLFEQTVGDLRPILLILFAATGLLLLLAAVNVTNLTLARGSDRAREIAVRSALGAGGRLIITQLVCESVLLAIAGGLIGVAAAYAGIRILTRFGVSHLPRLDTVSFDITVLALAVTLVMVTGVLVGILPALRLAGSDLSLLMNESGRTVKGSKKTRRLLAGFVVAEIAVAVALVAGAVRLVRSFDNIRRIDPGFQVGRQIVIDVVHPDRAYLDPLRMNTWWRAVESRIRGLGAAQVASTSALPLQREWDTTTFVDLRSQPGIPLASRPSARVRFVSPAFFSAMGIKILAGRAFTDDDKPGAPPVAILNEAFVKRFLQESDPLREQLKGFSNKIVDGKLVREDSAVVGVVADVRYSALTATPEQLVYVPAWEFFTLRQTLIVTPAEGHPLSPAQLRSAILEVEPKVALDFGTVAETVASSLERERLGMMLMAGFGIAALLLAIVGVFGVVAYLVSQRAGELAIRQVLGATRGQVIGMVLEDGAKVTALGVVIGLVIAWWEGRLIGVYLYQVRAGDPFVLAGSALVVSLAAIAAVLVPARRAAALEPARTLRQT